MREEEAVVGSVPTSDAECTTLASDETSIPSRSCCGSLDCELGALSVHVSIPSPSSPSEQIRSWSGRRQKGRRESTARGTWVAAALEMMRPTRPPATRVSID